MDDLRAGPRQLTREEAVEKALLHTFQLSNKDYRRMQAAMSEVAFIRALEQDGYTVAATPPGSSSPDAGTPDLDGLRKKIVGIVDDRWWQVGKIMAAVEEARAAAPSREPGDSLDVALRRDAIDHIEALNRLLATYRVGGRTPEKALDTLDRTQNVLTSLRATGASEATPEYRHPDPATLDDDRVRQTAAVHERLTAEYCFIRNCDLPQHRAPTESRSGEAG